MADQGKSGAVMPSRIIPPNFGAFTDLILERNRIRYYKERRAPRPWTEDPVLHRFHFTNTSRNDDWTTRWLDENWYELHREEDWGLLVFNAALARLVNLPEMLAEIGFITRYEPARLFAQLEARKARGDQTVSIAYHNVGHQAICECLINVWSERENIARVAREVGTLAAVTIALDRIVGFGSFRAFQTALDLTYTPVLEWAPDYSTFAVLGPGSAEGLDILFGRPHKRETKVPKVRQEQGLLEMRELQIPIMEQGNANLNVSDIEHSLCEFAKWWNATNNNKRPRRLYKPHSNPAGA
jgi:hypothetical protein